MPSVPKPTINAPIDSPLQLAAIWSNSVTLAWVHPA